MNKSLSVTKTNECCKAGDKRVDIDAISGRYLGYICLKTSSLMEAEIARGTLFNKGSIKPGIELDAGQLGFSKRLMLL